MQKLTIPQHRSGADLSEPEIIEGLVSIGASTSITQSEFLGPAYFGKDCTISNSVVGRFGSFGDLCRLVRTEIGGFSSVGDNVLFNAGVHPKNWLSTHLFQMHPTAWNWCEEGRKLTQVDTDFVWRGSCKVGHDVWIGANVTIQTGVTIGNGAIIGEGAFVNRDVPDYAIVAGKPASVVKYRFDANTIERLQKIQWWNLPFEQLQNLPYDKIEACLDQLEAVIRDETP